MERLNIHAQTSVLRLRHGYAKSEVMPNDPTVPKQPAPTGRKSPAAERALAEAAARRAARDAQNVERPKEIGGPKGPEPTRYDDWEKDGLTSDF